MIQLVHGELEAAYPSRLWAVGRRRWSIAWCFLPSLFNLLNSNRTIRVGHRGVWRQERYEEHRTDCMPRVHATLWVRDESQGTIRLWRIFCIAVITCPWIWSQRGSSYRRITWRIQGDRNSMKGNINKFDHASVEARLVQKIVSMIHWLNERKIRTRWFASRRK